MKSADTTAVVQFLSGGRQFVIEECYVEALLPALRTFNLPIPATKCQQFVSVKGKALPEIQLTKQTANHESHMLCRDARGQWAIPCSGIKRFSLQNNEIHWQKMVNQSDHFIHHQGKRLQWVRPQTLLDASLGNKSFKPVNPISFKVLPPLNDAFSKKKTSRPTSAHLRPTSKKKLLIFEGAHERYALWAADIVKLIEGVTLMSLPIDHARVKAFIRYDGCPIPVLSLDLLPADEQVLTAIIQHKQVQFGLQLPQLSTSIDTTPRQVATAFGGELIDIDALLASVSKL